MLTTIKGVIVNYDEFNDFCSALPATSYVVQWGGSYVWKVGGKVFAIGGWEKSGRPAYTFKTSELHFNILSDQPGFRPAPYLASRGMKWIQHYETLPETDEELKYYLNESHRIVYSGLSKKKQKELGLQ
ncbi:MAG TPA: MmcQ/YjbR family DNA-binding protein [Cellvibrionaceae bacterium]